MTTDDLIQMEQIKRLKYRYARLLDTKDWDGLASCFVEGATCSYSAGQLSFEGRDAIVDFLRNALGAPDVVTVHAMGHPEIELDGDTATAIWSLQDLVIHGSQRLVVRGSSLYEDRYERTSGGWLFTHTGYKRVYEEVLPLPAGHRVTATWWGTGGRSDLVTGL